MSKQLRSDGVDQRIAAFLRTIDGNYPRGDQMRIWQKVCRNLVVDIIGSALERWSDHARDCPCGQLAHSEVRPASDQCVQLSTIGVSHRRWLTLLGEVGELDAVLSPYGLVIGVRCGEMSRDDDDSKIGVLQTVSGVVRRIVIRRIP